MVHGEVNTSRMEIRLIWVSMAPMVVALFATSAYLAYLRAFGTEISDLFFLEAILLVIAAGCAFGVVLNELLLWRVGRRFRARRLAFRLALSESYLGLLVGLYTLLLTLLPQISTEALFAFSAGIAAWIFIAVAFKNKELFSRLDKA